MDAKVTTDNKTPHVFISYCWSNPEHEEWVINLAQRLVSDGIDVKIDKWDLKEGQDKFDFMESMVKAKNIDKVLIILDRKYSEKADARSGGVGTETQIISDKVYNDVAQEKFIPIVTQTNDDGKPFLPLYLNTRIYIDMSIDDQFEQKYEQLLRNLFQRPEFTKPKLGIPPKYLFEESFTSYTSSAVLRTFDTVILKNPKQINTLLRDFLDNFYNDLKVQNVSIDKKDSNSIAKSIIDNLNGYTPLRDNFIKFLNKLIRSQLIFDSDIIIKFFEKQPLLLQPQDGRGSWSSIEFDNFRFIIHELFLYLISICLKNERYDLLHEFLYSKYFLEDLYIKPEPKSFEVFHHHVTCFNDYYKMTFSQDFHSPMADMLIKRIYPEISKDELVDADLICFYISSLIECYWYPLCYVYKSNDHFKLTDRIVSQRHFEKVKILFDVSSTKELIDKLNKLKERKNSEFYGYVGTRGLTPIYRLINAETIASVR